MEEKRGDRPEWKHDETGGFAGCPDDGFFALSLQRGYSRYECYQTEQDWPLLDASSHITNTGRMVEEMEIKMRNLLQEVRILTDRCSDHHQRGAASKS